VQDGKVDLDSDVNRYLKAWALPESEFTRERKVTLRELLTHSAGIGTSGFDGYASGTPIPTVVQVLNGAAAANNAPVRSIALPGSGWSYSGGGYTIAQQVLTDVTGVAFPKLMENSVLRPFGMHASAYDQPLSPQRRAFAAIPYRSN